MSFHWNGFGWFLRIRDSKLALKSANTQRGCWRGASLRHNCGIAIAGLSSNHHQHHLSLSGVHDLRPHVSVSVWPYHRHIGKAALRQPSNLPRPATRQYVSGIRRDHCHQVLVAQVEFLLLLASLATLISPNTFLVPDGPQSDPRQMDIPLLLRRGDICRVSIQPIVREWRPHHRTASDGCHRSQSESETALQWIATSFLLRQPALATSVNSRATTEPGCPSEQW